MPALRRCTSVSLRAVMGLKSKVCEPAIVIQEASLKRAISWLKGTSRNNGNATQSFHQDAASR
jgi:hypothetical protein